MSLRRMLLPLMLMAGAGPAFAQAAPDANRGRVLFLQCAACHSVGRGAPHKVGPNLVGVYGAAAGSRPGYAYSPAFQKAKFTWDDPRLASFLERPNAVTPGTKMAFGGIADAAKRNDVIAYLKTLR